VACFNNCGIAYGIRCRGGGYFGIAKEDQYKGSFAKIGSDAGEFVRKHGQKSRDGGYIVQLFEENTQLSLMIELRWINDEIFRS
jgi:hypothetical protein